MKYILFFFVAVFSLQLSAEDSYDSRPSTPEGQEIQINEKDVQIVNRAAKILANKSNWNKNDNRECPPKQKKLSLFCALYKASVEINGKFDHRLGALEEVRRTVEEFSKGKPYEHRLMGYNNDTSTTLKDIQKVLKTTEDRLKDHLSNKKK